MIISPAIYIILLLIQDIHLKIIYMKNKTKIILIAIVILFASFFYIDYKLTFYGKNYFNIYNTLPCEIKIEWRSDADGGFMVFDKYGFNIISENYDNVKNVIAYFYNKNGLIFKVNDNNGNEQLFTYNKDNSIKAGYRLRPIETINNLDYAQINIINNKDFIYNLKILSNYMILFTIILIIILIILLLKRKSS